MLKWLFLFPQTYASTFKKKFPFTHQIRYVNPINKSHNAAIKYNEHNQTYTIILMFTK